MTGKLVLNILCLQIAISQVLATSDQIFSHKDAIGSVEKWWTRLSVQKPVKCNEAPTNDVDYHHPEFLQIGFVPIPIRGFMCGQGDKPINFYFQGKNGYNPEGPGRLKSFNPKDKTLISNGFVDEHYKRGICYELPGSKENNLPL